jgi:hypothetical protein
MERVSIFSADIVNCPIIKTYYTQYCIILRKVIRKAKQNYYNLLLSAENKPKTIWSIIKNKSGKVNNNNHIPSFFKLDKYSNRSCSQSL